jgi:hypothetical protein
MTSRWRGLLAVCAAGLGTMWIAAGSASAAGTNFWCDPVYKKKLYYLEYCQSGTYYTLNAARSILYRDDDPSQYGRNVYHCVRMPSHSGDVCTTESWRDIVLSAQVVDFVEEYQTGGSPYGHWFHGRAAYGGATL